MERHQKLLLEKEQFDMENERFDFLIAEVDKEREKLVDFEKKLRNRTTHRISECFSKNSVLNLKSPLKDNIKDLNIIYNDVKNYFNGNPEESCCKIKDRLIEKLKIEEKRNEDLRKRLNFSRARIASKNPLGISYQALNQWTIDIKKIMQDKTLECQKKYHLNKD
uniref:Uncharacterized protein n=1 Tax=Parastrongyloides trichosuri TaxID=131310 RepID=A0A0N4ZH18_PARTI